MKTYTEEDLRSAYQQGFNRANAIEGYPIHYTLTEDEYIERLKSQKIQEKEIPITYGLIKASCGWSRFAEVCDKNVYAINEWGDYKPNEIFYITESQAKQLKFI